MRRKLQRIVRRLTYLVVDDTGTGMWRAPCHGRCAQTFCKKTLWYVSPVGLTEDARLFELVMTTILLPTRGCERAFISRANGLETGRGVRCKGDGKIVEDMDEVRGFLDACEQA